MCKSQSPAEEASQRALESMYKCLDAGQSFRLEAGAGAGKTYSLIEALKYLIRNNEYEFSRRSQKIACITFTNVAKGEIASRIDRNPIVYCDTNHAFCWSLISGFQKQIRKLISEMPIWQEKIAEAGGGIDSFSIEYLLGYRSIREGSVSIHHDDVIPLTVSLMKYAKFRNMVADRYPIILVDEYQDTDRGWVDAIKELFLKDSNRPLFGFFGDHWQKIYDGGCGELKHAAITEIGKGANFRSVKTVVDCLNRMRPELHQFVKDVDADGYVHVFHTNGWAGDRRTGGHWGGDLPTEVGHAALELTRATLTNEGWDLSSEYTKVLMLTHRLLANEQGYASLPGVFRYNESFTKKEHPYVEFFVDQLEPACDAFVANRFGPMFEALGGAKPLLRSHADKISWFSAMDKLVDLRRSGTVGEVLDHLQFHRKPRLPEKIEARERELKEFDRSSGDELPNTLAEIEKFRAIDYSEVIALRSYLDGHSPFETKHGVKGAQFENVLVVVGRGWNRYNFGEMLQLAGACAVPAAKEEAFQRNRNLFYVACSRPKRRLALLFTQKLSPEALDTLHNWFLPENITAINLPQ